MTRERTRAEQIVARLREEPETADEVFDAFQELDALPVDVVREAFEGWLGPQPTSPPRPGLVILAETRDADILDLGSVAESQLRVAGRTWDGIDREPEERLDGELEDSFAGSLEHLVLGEPSEKRPLFDVVRFFGDTGVVFRAGTLECLGFIADGRVDIVDTDLRETLTDALQPKPPETKAKAKAKAKTKAAPKKKATAVKKKTASAKKKKATATATKK